MGLIPTTEQATILDATAPHIKINARAGTGKTTTLYLLAQRHEKKRILYVVYNKPQADLAKAVFPSNTTCLTIHGLAYRDEGHRWKSQQGDFGELTPSCFLEAYPSKNGDKQALAMVSSQFLSYFLNSPQPKLEAAVDPFLRIANETQQNLLTGNAREIIAACRQLTGLWNKRITKCPHDWYLKLFHHKGDMVAALNRYDLILCDELHDLSPVMADGLRQTTTPWVGVGDPHQQIYAFRYAINAMDQLTADETFPLTQSFRYGKTLAQVIQTFVRESLDASFVLHGNPDRQTTVFRYENAPPINAQRTVLSRTNLTLFANLLELHRQRVPYRFERDLKGVFQRTLDAYYLFSGKPEKIWDPFIKSFKSFLQAQEYAQQMEDYQLSSMLNIVAQYHYAFPGIFYEVRDMLKQTQADPNAVVLSTIHSAKGCEYPSVIVSPDVAEALARKDTTDEESRAAYVALSRGMYDVSLPGYLRQARKCGLAWQQTIDALPVREGCQRGWEEDEEEIF